MLDKNRGRAYRQIKAGLRFHQNEKLSFVTIGFRRGFEPDIPRVMQQLNTRIKRDTSHKTDYFLGTVRENTDSTKDDDRWRVHQHMIWNAPYILQSHLVSWLQSYAGDNVSVRINLVNNDHTRAARYMMQYIGNQAGTVTYSKSVGWLPKGHRSAWDWCKRESRENHVICLNPYTIAPPISPVTLFENWIDEQRGLLL
jgi:hypothetical protein